MAYEDKLSAVCFEKRQLESHVRALHVSCVAGGATNVAATLPAVSLTTGGLTVGQGAVSAAPTSIETSHPAVNSSHLGSFHESPSINDKVSRMKIPTRSRRLESNLQKTSLKKKNE